MAWPTLKDFWRSSPRHLESIWFRKKKSWSVYFRVLFFFLLGRGNGFMVTILKNTRRWLIAFTLDWLRIYTFCKWSHFDFFQKVLSNEDYSCWLKSHIEAEASIENREELLFQSASRIETNLHLLGILASKPYINHLLTFPLPFQ